MPVLGCFVVNEGDLREDLDGVEIVDAAAAGVVLLGGAGPSVGYEELNAVFGLALRGVPIVALHRNVRYQTAEGPALDMGAFIVGLEAAAEVRVTVVGKPAPAFFAAALTDLGVGRRASGHGGGRHPLRCARGPGRRNLPGCWCGRESSVRRIWRGTRPSPSMCSTTSVSCLLCSNPSAQKAESADDRLSEPLQRLDGMVDGVPRNTDAGPGDPELGQLGHGLQLRLGIEAVSGRVAAGLGTE